MTTKASSAYAVFSNVFDVTQEEVDEFDKSFPPKEKKYQASQEEFEAASSMIDE